VTGHVVSTDAVMRGRVSRFASGRGFWSSWAVLSTPMLLTMRVVSDMFPRLAGFGSSWLTGDSHARPPLLKFIFCAMFEQAQEAASGRQTRPCPAAQATSLAIVHGCRVYPCCGDGSRFRMD